MPPPKQQRRRALELLEASIDGCTEAIMLAYGFKTELLVELVNAGLATATIDRMVVGGAPGQSHPHADYCGWPAGAREASMALIPKRALSFSGDRTAGLSFRLHCRTYGGARTNALAIENNVCIGWRRLLLRHRPRDGSVVSSLHCMNDPQPESHMASYIGRRKFLATLGGAAAWPLAAPRAKMNSPPAAPSRQKLP